MKKVFTLLLFAAAFLMCPVLKAQNTSNPVDNPFFKAALERAKKVSGAENARFAADQTRRVAQTETYATWGDNNQWQDEGRLSFTFNNRGLIETTTEVELPSNANVAQYTYTYNSQGIPTELVAKAWSNNTWVNNSKLAIEMEGELVKSFGIYSWNNTAWAMLVGLRSTHNKTNNRVTETITESFSSIPGSATNGWVLSERLVYAYTGSDNRPTSITTYTREGSNWVETKSETNIVYVGSTNDISSYFLEELDKTTNTWSKYKYEYAYTQNTANKTRTIVEAAYEVEGSTTTPSIRTTTTLLTSGEPYVTEQQVGLLVEANDGANNWVRDTEEKAIVTRDNNGDITQIVHQEFSPATNAFVNVERYTYSNFTTITITSVADDALALATEVYPNPAQNSLRISLDATKVRNASLNIYSITGQKVYEQEKLAATSTLDISKLPAGIYMVRITDNNANVTRRIVKQ